MAKETHDQTPGKPGPNSPQGLEVSSRNATKHAMTARKLIVQDESLDDFNLLLAQYHAKYPSQDPVLEKLVTSAAEYDWFLQRNQRGYDATMAKLYQTEQQDWTEAQHAEYQRTNRYLTAAQRQLDRARQQILQDYRETRAQARPIGTATVKEGVPVVPEVVAAPLPEPEWTPTRQTVQIFTGSTGQTHVLVKPPNKNLLKILEKCPKVPSVLRIISFPKGEIPSDYAWLPVTNPSAKLTYKLELDEFREQAAREPERAILPTNLDRK